MESSTAVLNEDILEDLVSGLGTDDFYDEEEERRKEDSREREDN